MTAQAVAEARQRPLRRRRIQSRRRAARCPSGKQLLLQLLCLGVTFTVLFPILWIVALVARPAEPVATGQPDPARGIARRLRAGARPADQR